MVLQKVWVLYFYMLPVVMSGLPQQELADVFHGKFSFLCHQCVKGKKNTAGGSAALMDLVTCVGLGRLLTT